MFWNRFYKLCEEHNTKPNPLGKKLGISSGVITRWKQENAYPTVDLLIKISDYFGCSIDYLIGRSDNPISHIYEISEEDMNTLNKYHLLSEKNKMESISFMDFKLYQQQNKL